jgi:3-oxoacyl-[acyl-carrier-protein] synthase II
MKKALKDSERVVVTGLGVVSAIGTGKDEFWKNLLKGQSGISRIDSLDTSPHRTAIGAEIKDFDPSLYIASRNLKNYGRTSQLGIAGARLALKDAGLADHHLKGKPVDIIIGTTIGESQVMEKINDRWLRFGEGEVSPQDIATYPENVIALSISREIGLDAECIVIPTACAAGNYAIGYGHDRIRNGSSSVVIAGGCESFNRITFTGFNSIFAVAPERCQPFDRNRKGIIVGEGAGILILESLEHALARNALIYAEILGYGLSCDASHMTIPSVDGIMSVMEKALSEAGLEKEDVDYISAHGTGTPMNDKIESQAINRVFGDRSRQLPVSSIKSMLGHSMGAASAIEAAVCSLAVRLHAIPATINFETPDPDCPVDCVPNHSRRAEIDVALNNSFAFGGNNACVAFGKLK